MGLGDTATLEIERMGQAGDGVARLSDGRLVFISGALPGEIVEVRITEERKNFSRGQIVNQLSISEDRIEPICPIFDECGGCSFQHWDYSRELIYKEGRVREALRRIAHIESPPLMSIRGSRNPYGYRNKGQFPFGGRVGAVTLGLFQRGTHQVIDAQQCDIQDSLINQVLKVGAKVANQLGLSPYDETSHQGLLRHLLIRSSRASGEMLVLLVVTEDHPMLRELATLLMHEVAAIKGVGMNINPARTNRILGSFSQLLMGERTIIDSIMGLWFRMSFTSFFQVNPEQVGVLYEAALSFLPSSVGEVWDLYSGVGTLAALAATRAVSVRALELNPDAVDDAEENFRLNHLENVSIQVGRVEDVMSRWVQERRQPPDAVIFDPPRSGLNAEVLHPLMRLRPHRIIYVSCNPDTWARDIASLKESYHLEMAIPVDMFPRTDHVEVASCLVRSC